MTTAIETQNFRQAENLLQALHPRERRYGPDPRRWAFRGQRDSNWNLEPSALRADSWRRFAHGTEHLDRATESSEGFEKLSRELMRMLAAFMHGLDEGGLPVPGDSPAVRRLLARSGQGGEIGEIFDNEELAPLLALARHHGLPTPLLDWSWDGRVASYFAAVDVVQRQDWEGSLCIWAFDTTFAEDFWRPADGAINIIPVPRATNPNMHAQSGLFTTCGGLAGWYDLRGYVEHLWTAAIEDQRSPPTPTLWRFLLPKREAPQLLALLAHERIDGARLFPGPDGVVRRLEERLLWEHYS